jgi:hypothetical protein
VHSLIEEEHVLDDEHIGGWHELPQLEVEGEEGVTLTLQQVLAEVSSQLRRVT